MAVTIQIPEETGQRFFECFHIFKERIVRDIFAESFPEAFDRIQVGAISRKEKEFDPCSFYWPFNFLCMMPARVV